MDLHIQLYVYYLSMLCFATVPRLMDLYNYNVGCSVKEPEFKQETKGKESIETSSHRLLSPHHDQGSTSLEVSDVAVVEEEVRPCIPHRHPHRRTQGCWQAAQAHSVVVFVAGDEDWALPVLDTRRVDRSSRYGSDMGWERRTRVGRWDIGNGRMEGPAARRFHHHRNNMDSVLATRDDSMPQTQFDL